MRKTHTIQFRVTKEVHAKFVEKAKLRGLTLSEWLTMIGENLLFEEPVNKSQPQPFHPCPKQKTKGK